MKVTIVGTSSAYPTKDNPTSSYLIQSPEGNVLLDCGSGSMMALDGLIDLEELDYIFISHKHPDHIADLGVLQHRRLVKKMMQQDLPDLQIFGAFEDLLKSEIEAINSSQVFNLAEVKHIGPFTVRFQQTNHPVETYAIRLEVRDKSIVYTSDTAYCEDLIEFAKDADLLVTESSLYPTMDGTQSGHMNVNEAINFSIKSQAKQVLLSHLPEYGPREIMEAEVNKAGLKNISFAKPNMTINV